jgi:hypothetical protein
VSRTSDAQAHKPTFSGSYNHIAHLQTDGRDACDLFTSVSSDLISIFPVVSADLMSIFPVLKNVCIIVSSVLWEFHHYFCLVCLVFTVLLNVKPWNNLISTASMEDLYENALESLGNIHTVFPLLFCSCIQTAIIKYYFHCKRAFVSHFTYLKSNKIYSSHDQ